MRRLIKPIVAVAYLGLIAFYGAFILLGVRLLWQGLSGGA